MLHIRISLKMYDIVWNLEFFNFIFIMSINVQSILNEEWMCPGESDS